MPLEYPMKGTRTLPTVVSEFVLRLVVLAVLQTTSVHSGTAYYDFVVSYAFRSPDFVEKAVITVNGEFPGPTIRVRAGDQLEVKVKNDMVTDGVTIHWHGIRQRGTPWADGAAYVTQCPISPGETFTYNFATEQPGTFFYHGHYGMQRGSGLYGFLIVEPQNKQEDPFTYDGELNILLSDWFHRSQTELLAGLTAPIFRWTGNPQSLLINGRGRFNCSLMQAVRGYVSAPTICNMSLVAPAVLSVEHGKTYRVRILSAASLATLNFFFEGHNFTIVEVDGHYVEPVQATSVYLFSGQSVSVLLNATEDPSRNYWAALDMRERNSNTPTGLAILNYIPNPPNLVPPTPTPNVFPWDHHAQNLRQHRSLVALKGTESRVPQVANRRLILLNSMGITENGRLSWAINNVSYILPKTPSLALYKYNFTEDFAKSSQLVDEFYSPGSYDIYNVPDNPNVQTGSRAYVFQLNDVVDVILQNTNILIPNKSEVHPWHLHGHDFWVLGFGLGVFDATRDFGGLNDANPPLRNTVPVYPYGWTAIRFVADNPGVWNFHCHLEAHHHMGMALVFSVAADQIPAIPRQALGCGLTK